VKTIKHKLRGSNRGTVIDMSISRLVKQKRLFKTTQLTS